MHNFTGKWITDEEFARLEPRNVFHRYLEKLDVPCNEHRNRHILFRKKFTLNCVPENAEIEGQGKDRGRFWKDRGRFCVSL